MKKTKEKGISLILLVIIIIGIVFLAGLCTYMFINRTNGKNVSDDNLNQGESNVVEQSNIFESEKYALIYDLPEIETLSGEYWDSSYLLDTTQKENLSGSYKRTIESHGGKMQWQEKQDFTMYFKPTRADMKYDEIKYYIQIDFNEGHAFYPDSLKPASSVFKFYVLDNEKRFNYGSIGYMQDTPMDEVLQRYEDEEVKKILEDGKWEMYSISEAGSNQITLLVNYYLNSEKTDYMQFDIILADKLDNKATNELMQKLKNNFKIKIIEDESIIQYLDSIRENDKTIDAGYIKLNNKDEQITINDGLKLNMHDTNIYDWNTDNGGTFVSCKNYLDWYDFRWKNGAQLIELREFENVKNSTLEEFAEYKLIDINTDPIEYNGVSIRCAIKEYSGLDIEEMVTVVDLIFAYGDSIYVAEWKPKGESVQGNQITEFVQYLFDNIIIMK